MNQNFQLRNNSIAYLEEQLQWNKEELKQIQDLEAKLKSNIKKLQVQIDRIQGGYYVET